MRQIPTSGEYCGECDFINESGCHPCCYLYYNDTLDWDKTAGDWKRLPDCLRDKPQVLTLEDRKALVDRGLRFAQREAVDSAAKPYDGI